MKYSKALLMLTLALVLVVALAACSNTPSQPQQTTLSSITATYTGDDIKIGGGTLNSSDVVVTALYSDGTSKSVTNFTLSTLDTSTAGTKSVTVTYTEGDITKTCEISVNVVDGTQQPTKTAISIKVTSPIKEVKRDTVVAASDVTVTVRYNDGTEETLSGDQYQLTYDFSIFGTVPVVVSYQPEGSDKVLKAEFYVLVKDIAFITAEYSGPEVYLVGDEFDASNITVYEVYSDGERVLLSSDSYEVSGFDSETKGVKKVTVTSQKGFTSSFSVSVYETETLWFFDYMDWGTVYASYWYSSTQSAPSPLGGVQMTRESEDSDWFYVKVPTATLDEFNDKIIFHNNNGIQTNELTINHTNIYYGIVDWSASKDVSNIFVFDVSKVGGNWQQGNEQLGLVLTNSKGVTTGKGYELTQKAPVNKTVFVLDVSEITLDYFQVRRYQSGSMTGYPDSSWYNTVTLNAAQGLYVRADTFGQDISVVQRVLK